MDAELFKDVPVEKRAQMLRDNADEVVNESYTKTLTPEELTEIKDSLSGIAININDIEEEKKVVVNVFKARLNPLKNEMKEKLKAIKYKAIMVKGELFKMVDRETRMVGFYDVNGDLISSRPAMADELQGTFMQVLRTGTNN